MQQNVWIPSAASIALHLWLWLFIQILFIAGTTHSFDPNFVLGFLLILSYSEDNLLRMQSLKKEQRSPLRQDSQFKLLSHVSANAK